MKNIAYFIVANMMLICTSCSTNTDKAGNKEEPDEAEVAKSSEDWVWLFDGESTTGWRGFNSDSLPEGWMLRIKNTGLYRLSFEDSKKYPFSLVDFWNQHQKATAVIKWKGHLRRTLLDHGSAYVDAALSEGDG